MQAAPVLESTVKLAVRVSPGASFITVIVIVAGVGPAKIGKGTDVPTVVVAGVTVREAVLLAPLLLPLSVAVMPEMLSLIVPVAVAVTLTMKEQVAPAAPSVPPERLIDCEPATAVIVPLPQEPVTVLGVSTNRLAGRVSVKFIPLRELDPFGLLIRKFKVVEKSTTIVEGLKEMLTPGGTIADPDNTVRLAVLLVAPVPASVEETVPVVLLIVPGVLLVTWMPIWQLEPAPSDTFARLTEVAPAPVPARPPPQPLKGVVPKTVSPAGRVSVTAIPLNELELLGLLTTKTRLVTPPSGIEASVKDTVTVGDEGVPAPGVEYIALADCA